MAKLASNNRQEGRKQDALKPRIFRTFILFFIGSVYLSHLLLVEG